MNTSDPKNHLLDRQLNGKLNEKIKLWGQELGFQHVGISDIDLSAQEPKMLNWLEKGFHGEMGYMETHGTKRSRPAELLPGTVSIVSVRLDYLPPDAKFAATLEQPNHAFISRYALGRDYHKVIRNKLKKLGQMIEKEVGVENLSFRPFVDSAPVLERPIAEKAGLGWTGKHSLLINNTAGSWFFLGELFLPIALEPDQAVDNECGSCVACITTCPTQAIVEPYVVDGRKCISYLTIELKDSIPEQYRKAMGNRIYGCDDCQLICPWNRFAELSTEPDFLPRTQLHPVSLLELWQWQEPHFLKVTEGSPIRRIGFECWMRNIAIALGNAPFSLEIVEQLNSKLTLISDMVDEHILWALEQQKLKAENSGVDSRQLKRLIKAIKIGLPRDA
ncbi:epoxyqueuosine reductase [Psychrosphaera saromensis]|uniref:Epoxyqueuosine reductase n=1 Tax=Psychrosphaera saromensis TaxID=716813 RepID=A0A2S7UVA5_9GAMM|nr:tRNA epoxyqueuosine(34) reductase QueG [Psychrosphaera saromensis]PQJ53201.1 tRNA epoxyqueuosine(34) reductase QueG [Psychrosphaera saromensis]GHB67207.1 epoxyqueuosine reductase [Psychrosphaera saromensis]GLQ15036.1 epoxyqueuosine reductase [Psychrosphaera saromensis]